MRECIARHKKPNSIWDSTSKDINYLLNWFVIVCNLCIEFVRIVKQKIFTHFVLKNQTKKSQINANKEKVSKSTINTKMKAKKSDNFIHVYIEILISGISYTNNRLENIQVSSAGILSTMLNWSISFCIEPTKKECYFVKRLLYYYSTVQFKRYEIDSKISHGICEQL